MSGAARIVADVQKRVPPPGAGERVDALVHPVCLDRSLREHLPAPWRDYSLTKPEHYVYPPPFGEYRPGLVLTSVDDALGGDSRGVASASRGITPQQVRDELLGPEGVGTAILLPLARGLQSDPDFDAVIASGINEWLAATWLTEGNADGRFKGSIRVSPQHPVQAVAEVRKWAGHPHMVQVAVPLQAKSPYGDRSYWPIWEAAAENGYPIAVHADTGDGIEAVPTAMGFPLTTYAMHVLQPLNGLIHLASLVAQGVFARIGSLRWVFGDGAFHAYPPVFWRFNNDDTVFSGVSSPRNGGQLISRDGGTGSADCT